MIDCNTFLGLPIEFKPLNSNSKKPLCKIYPPKVQEVCQDNNLSYIGLLTMSQEDIEDKLVENKQLNAEKKIPTPFEYLLLLSQNAEGEKNIREAIEFFVKEPVSILLQLNAILVGDLEKQLLKMQSINDLRLITEDNFFEFQNLIRQSIGEKPIEKPDPNEHPKIRAMKAKARLRDRIKAKSGKALKLNTTLAAICCMGIGITPLNIGEITYGSAQVLMKMYQNKEKYDLDMKSLLAGADSKKIKPKYWIMNIDD